MPQRGARLIRRVNQGDFQEPEPPKQSQVYYSRGDFYCKACNSSVCPIQEGFFCCKCRKTIVVSRQEIEKVKIVAWLKKK
jgi:hypothetical protein